MSNNSDVPPGLVGKESIIFGNIEDIYSFHNKYVARKERYNFTMLTDDIPRPLRLYKY